MSLIVHDVSPDLRDTFRGPIAALESGVTYPLGTDRFEIDHGADYFRFFDRMGELTYYAVTDGDEVVAVMAAILRRVPLKPNAKPQKVWYGSDVKVRRSHRGRRILWTLFTRGFPRKYPVCRRGYAITMNPPGNDENPVVRLVSRFGLVPISVATQLVFYSLNAQEMNAVSPLLTAELGPLSYLSLGGIKDIVLQSTGAPMPLLHLQHGPCAQGGLPTPVEGSVHMFCLPEGDPLLVGLEAMGLTPSATASVVHHRMGGTNWRFVLTSDI